MYVSVCNIVTVHSEPYFLISKQEHSESLAIVEGFWDAPERVVDHVLIVFHTHDKTINQYLPDTIISCDSKCKKGEIYRKRGENIRIVRGFFFSSDRSDDIFVHTTPEKGEAKRKGLIFKLEGFSRSDVDGAAAVRASLLLVLFLGKALPASHAQVFVRTLGVRIRNIIV